MRVCFVFVASFFSRTYSKGSILSFILYHHLVPTKLTERVERVLCVCLCVSTWKRMLVARKASTHTVQPRL